MTLRPIAPEFHMLPAEQMSKIPENTSGDDCKQTHQCAYLKPGTELSAIIRNTEIPSMSASGLLLPYTEHEKRFRLKDPIYVRVVRETSPGKFLCTYCCPVKMVRQELIIDYDDLYFDNSGKELVTLKDRDDKIIKD